MTWAPSKREGAFNIQSPANAELTHTVLKAKFNIEGCAVSKVEKPQLAGAIMRVSGGRVEAVSQEECVFLKMRVEERDDLRAKT